MKNCYLSALLNTYPDPPRLLGIGSEGHVRLLRPSAAAVRGPVAGADGAADRAVSQAEQRAREAAADLCNGFQVEGTSRDHSCNISFVVIWAS